RRRTHAHGQGAPAPCRREVCVAGRCALRRPEDGARGGAGTLRGWPHRIHFGRPEDSRRQAVPGRGRAEGGLTGMSDQARAGRIGEVILALDGVSLAFGGVKTLSNVSFDVREHEVRAIIGPNGAGKSSMLNVINGVYHPQQGTITFRGEVRRDMNTHKAATQGIARTFQNIALFKGMSVLDNIMTGRNLKMHATFIEQAIYFGRARREEL